MNILGGTSTTSFATVKSTSAVGTTDSVKILTGNNGNQFAFVAQDFLGDQVNVGIGSSVPNGSLDVEGTISAKFFAIPGSIANLGIGTVNPGVLLDVQGTARINNGFFLKMYDSGGVSWSCRPAVTTGTFTCTSP